MAAAAAFRLAAILKLGDFLEGRGEARKRHAHRDLLIRCEGGHDGDIGHLAALEGRNVIGGEADAGVAADLGAEGIIVALGLAGIDLDGQLLREQRLQRHDESAARGDLAAIVELEEAHLGDAAVILVLEKLIHLAGLGSFLDPQALHRPVAMGAADIGLVFLLRRADRLSGIENRQVAIAGRAAAFTGFGAGAGFGVCGLAGLGLGALLGMGQPAQGQRREGRQKVTRFHHENLSNHCGRVRSPDSMTRARCQGEMRSAVARHGGNPQAHRHAAGSGIT